MLPTDPESAGPYRLLGRLGAGGMGEVYLARSPGGRPVAVKVIRPELATDPGFRARFAREVAAARTVSGIFTAPVVDADTEAARPWLATAYVAGPSLAEAVAQRGPLPPGVVLTLGAGLAEGLQAIHAAGLVHRDLKPSNVLLADDGPRVIDFGIARAADGTGITQTGTVLGSPGFLSPEQAEGKSVGPASDVFSLGAVLSYAVVGQGPFGEGSPASLAYRVVNSDPNLAGVPAQLRPLLERCLAKDPVGRPTAGELLASFAAAQPNPRWPSATAGLEGAPTQAGFPPSAAATPAAAPGYAPPGRRGRRRWALIAAAAAAVVVAVSAGITLAAGGSGGNAGSGPTTRATASARLTAGAAPIGQPSAKPAAGNHPKATPPGKAPGHGSGSSSSPSSLNGPGPGPAPGPGHGPSPAPGPGHGPGPAAAGTAVAGWWTGTYTCNQGLTGMRLTITPSAGGAVHALADFYPVASNPDTASGSYELTGSYSAASGLILTPAYWISEPPGYEMVSLSAPPPRGSTMAGTVEGLNCTTFSVTR
ncbi:MAG TPA: serine/threonine-protein kinase [Trebonia sp.]|nr:serine/threonine-protein kinase [Trebonia sp.]